LQRQIVVDVTVVIAVIFILRAPANGTVAAAPVQQITSPDKGKHNECVCGIDEME
jgi:hypothetical protein